MKKYLFTVIFIIFSYYSYGQSDTIFTSTEKIICNIKEVTPEAVKYTYPGEDVIITIYKNTVLKITFKSGRVQTFSESSSFKTVKDVSDFNNVSITQVESEVLGLIKLGDLSAKAKGAWTLSNQELVKERAYKKLKIVAAMMGANVVYIINQRTEGNKMGGYYQSGSTAETNLTGIAYTNQIPNYDDFISIISDKKTFEVVQIISLQSNSLDMSISESKGKLDILSLTNEKGLIILDGNLSTDREYTKFRVVRFDNEYFNIYYETKNTSYNIIIKV